jgi:hypothetical protein
LTKSITSPVTKGMVKLSFMGKEAASTIVAIAAPAKTIKSI